ncbi:MAG TPA: NAD(P)H-quinone oxidoreductase, partial [Thermoanaerobaculia bacterium]|nr:NAD(P)H-quinone oxidoreductase [Thermoanaerobaculia bacterium]
NRADPRQAAGKYPPPPGAPEILWLEAAGEVEGTGERVFFLLPGGGYAGKVAVPAGMLMRIPEGMSFIEAASIPEAWFTAYLNLFLEAGLKAGEKALIHAAGSGVGTAAVQLVRRAGATAIATARSGRKLGVPVTLGAALAIDTSTADFAAEIEKALGPNAVDVVLDPVGGAFLERNLRVMARGGRLVLIAAMAGGSSTIDLRAVLSKRLRIVGSTLRSRPAAEKVALTAAFVKGVLPGFADGSLAPVVDSVLPLARAGDAFRRMASNENVGKIVLTVD